MKVNLSMPRVEKKYPIDRPFLTIRYDPLRLEVRQATEKGYAEVYVGGGI